MSTTIEEILGQLEISDDEEVNNRPGDEDDNMITQLVNKMIFDAYSKGASDIHIEPGDRKSR